MKAFIIFAFTFLCMFSTSGINIEITNPNQADIKNAPVVVKLDHFKKTGPTKRDRLAVYIDGKQVSSQLDDLNNDSIPDELVFLTDLKAGEKKKVQLRSISDKKRIKFPAEVHATKWYPTDDDQLAVGYNDDTLLVSGWVGVGTVKGFEKNKATHINKFDLRTHRIVATGNIRTVVESDVKGWEYEGKKADMTVRYILYARHRDVIAEITTSTDIDQLATGVQQIGGGACFQSNQLVGAWGSCHPQPDTLKYAKETVGLGLYMPKEFQGKQIMEGVNNLIVFPQKKETTTRFYFIVIAEKEEQNDIKTAEDFFKYLNNWRRGLNPVIVE